MLITTAVDNILNIFIISEKTQLDTICESSAYSKQILSAYIVNPRTDSTRTDKGADYILPTLL